MEGRKLSGTMKSSQLYMLLFILSDLLGHRPGNISSSNLTMVLVAPLRPLQEWFPVLLSLLVVKPVIRNLLVQPRVRKFHQITYLEFIQWHIRKEGIVEQVMSVTTHIQRSLVCRILLLVLWRSNTPNKDAVQQIVDFFMYMQREKVLSICN